MELQYLNHYIKNLDSTNPDKLREDLYKSGILSKDYPEDNLLVLYNRFNANSKSKLETQCRSVVVDKTTLEMVCYSYPTPIYNWNAVQYLSRNKSMPRDTFQCYEGTLVSLFNYNGKWFLSTRKCIHKSDIEDSEQTNETGHYKMFMDVLRLDGYTTLDSFTKFLDPLFTFHFVLIHHLNKNIVNYTKQFGENYKKLCFIFARDKNFKETSANEMDIFSDNIFRSLPLLESAVDENDYTKLPESEGVIVKINNQVLKIQTPAYIFHKAIGSEKNMLTGFICLYQINKLVEYFTNNPNAEKFKKIVNPLKITESYDTVGMIDAIFKVITSELYYLFYILWDNDMNHLNNSLYNILPKEYKDILFQLRGKFFSNKKHFKTVNEFLKMKDIYNYIKSIDANNIEQFIRSRKLMLNWLRVEKDVNTKLYLDTFNNSLHQCEKVYYKLAAIYTTKLFPEIMPDDIPPSAVVPVVPHGPSVLSENLQFIHMPN
jgi:hypothetical protein